MTDSQVLADNQADNTLAHLREVWAAVDTNKDHEGQPAEEYLYEWPLEVVWRKGAPFQIILGTNGPHVVITQDVSDTPEPALEVYWSGGRASRRDPVITRTADYFRSALEG